MSNQLAVKLSVIAGLWEEFKNELKVQTNKVFTEYVPVLPVLDALPLIVGGALFVSIVLLATRK